MNRLYLPLAASLGLTAISIVTAFAHSSLERPEAPAGSYKAVLRIPHGCDGKATNQVKVVLPEGFVGAKPMPKAGWQLAIENDDYSRTYKLHGRDVSSGLKVATWSDGELPDAFYDEFVISGSLDAAPGDRLPFLVTQQCGDSELAWDQIAAEGQDPHALERPAPFVTIAASGGGHDMHAGHAAADEVHAGDLVIGSGWLKAMLPGQPAGGGYVTITNNGDAADRLVSVSTPAAGKSEIHEMKVENDVMTMRPVPGGLEIPAGATVELKPGGLHLMFMQVSEPFTAGSSVPVTLEFEKAGKVDLSLPVRPAGPSNGADSHGMGDHSDH